MENVWKKAFRSCIKLGSWLLYSPWTTMGRMSFKKKIVFRDFRGSSFPKTERILSSKYQKGNHPLANFSELVVKTRISPLSQFYQRILPASLSFFCPWNLRFFKIFILPLRKSMTSVNYFRAFSSEKAEVFKLLEWL